MKITIKSVTFSNILSFGNKSTTLDISSGLTAITGSNGAGKSSLLLDTISFCLFGKPYRKIKLEKLINRKNKKGLLVECVLTIDNTDTFTITRGLSPTILTITKNGEPLQLLSSKKLNQSEIDDIIGINYELFKQIISLSINYNKPFITLEAKEKRDLIEQLFNIKVFGEMLKNIKKESSELRINIDTNNKILTLSKENLIQLKQQVGELTTAMADFDKVKVDDTNTAKAELDEVNSQLSEVLAQIPGIEKTLSELIVADLTDIKIEKTVLIKSVSTKEAVLSYNKKTMTHLNANDVCPSCKNSISPDHKEQESLRCITENSAAEAEIIELNKRLEEIENEIDLSDTNKSKKLKIEFELKSLSTKRDSLLDRKGRITDNIRKISERSLNVNADAVKKEYATKTKDYKSLSAEQSVLTDKFEVNQEVAAVLSDTGIKKFIIEKIVPFLNQSVNYYLEYFDLPVRLEFNSEMEETIKILGHHSDDESYYSFSEGEKKRIDMAILLSFIKLTKILSNWNCNLLIIDELLDSSIDDAGLDKLLKSFKKISNESEDQSIFIISHKLHNEHIGTFDKIVNIQKSSTGFSSITEGGD